MMNRTNYYDFRVIGDIVNFRIVIAIAVFCDGFRYELLGC